ncbi:hypothetical protein [Mycobacterium leprae]|uniref:hypothetical protein n=1 Tax=Mycobacterium leprae TaxID=1769 RepID=UPI001E60E487|nr:hypothetical protein [Mycobacterium leprae]
MADYRLGESARCAVYLAAESVLAQILVDFRKTPRLATATFLKNAKRAIHRLDLVDNDVTGPHHPSKLAAKIH